MDFTLIYFIAAVMVAAGLGFVYLLVRRNPRYMPRDAFEWFGVSLSVLLVGAAVFLFGVTLQAQQEVAVRGPVDAMGNPTLASDELNAPARDFTFRRVDDDAASSLSAYRGRVVLLNFWATWCPPCLGELPDLNRLQETYGEEGLTVLTISDETRDALTAFEEEMPLQTVSGYVEGAEALPQPYQRTLQVRPTTYIIDREGVVRAFVLGARDYATFEQMVRPYLADRSAGA